MGFVDDFSEKTKNAYYFFEDKWYDVLDKIDEKIPVYNVIDRVDEVIPSFILFLLIILFLIILTGYFIQFSSPIEITFTTIDSTTQALLSGVNIRTIALNESRDGTTNTQGILKVNFEEPTKNIYNIFIEMLTGTKEVDLTIDVRADKTGYVDFLDTFYSGREHTLKLSPLPVDVEPKLDFKSQTTVRLIDSKTQNTIIDNTNAAYVEFNCQNKNINNKKVYSNSGSFELNESNCHFRVVEAYSPGYSRTTNTRLLPVDRDSHTIQLNKIVSTGSAKIWVFEQDDFDSPISGAEVVIAGKSEETDNGGLAVIEDLPIGEHEVFVTKTGYRSIRSSDEITIEITTGQPSEKELFLIPIDPDDERRIYLQVVDSNSADPVSGVSVTLRQILDNNSVGSAMLPIRSTDINGLFENKNFEVGEEDTIVAVLEKEDYVIKIIKPELFDLNSGPQIVELEKVIEEEDDDGNPFYPNSGFSEVNVKQKSGDIIRPLQNATVNMLIKEIYNIKELPLSPKTTNNQGIAKFSGLATDLNYLARATYENISEQSDQSKHLDANQTIKFELTLDLDNSKIIINLENELNQTITDANIILYQANEDFDDFVLKETLENIEGQYHSGLYSRKNNYQIDIHAQGYVSKFIRIDYKYNPLKSGTNEFDITLREKNDDQVQQPTRKACTTNNTCIIVAQDGEDDCQTITTTKSQECIDLTDPPFDQKYKVCTLQENCEEIKGTSTDKCQENNECIIPDDSCLALDEEECDESDECTWDEENNICITDDDSTCTNLNKNQCDASNECTWDDTDEICRPDDYDPTDGRVIIRWDDIYNLNDRIWVDDSTVDIIYNEETYRAQINVEIAKQGIDYNTLLAMVRTENAIIENMYITPGRGEDRTVLASCDNSHLDDEDSRTETYYLRNMGNEDCLENEKIVAGAKWSEQKSSSKNYLQQGTYSIAIDFTVKGTEEVIFYFRAKEERNEAWSETDLKQRIVPVGVPFRSDIITLEAKIENNVVNFSNNLGAVMINHNEPTNLEIVITNKKSNAIQNGKVTVYSHTGATSEFDEDAETLRGNVLFSTGETFNRKSEVLGDNITLTTNQPRSFETKFKVDEKNASNYLVIVFEHDEEKEIYFITLTTTGRKIRVRSDEFLSGVPNQKFSGEIIPVDSSGNPVIDSGKINVYTENGTEVHSNININIKDDEKQFDVTIPGTYVSGDYLILEIRAREKGTNEMYEQFSRQFIAGAHGTTDRGIACVDIYHVDHGDKFYNLNWGDDVGLTIINRCNSEVMLFVETALVCEYEDNADCRAYKKLAPDETMEITIFGRNITFDPEKGAPNFTDLLGYFPINVKARFLTRNIFSNASNFSINLRNEGQCFEYVGTPELDFTESNQRDITIINHCYYRGITNYFIPRMDLRAFGYDLTPSGATAGNQSITFSVELEIDGPARSFKSDETTIESMDSIYTVHAEDLPADKVISQDEGLAKYIVSFDLSTDVSNYNTSLGDDWYHNRLQVRIIDNDSLSDNYGAKIVGDIRITYDDQTTDQISPAGNFELDPFRRVSGSARVDSGDDFWGEGFEVADDDQTISGDWHVGYFYQTINNKKISQVDIDFIGIEATENEELTQFLEFSIRPQMRYTQTSYVEEISESTGATVSLGEYSIPRIGGVGFILKSMGDLEEEGFFENTEFLSRVNPKLNRIHTSSDEIIVWVENGFLFAGYFGESPYISPNDQEELKGTITQRLGTTSIYGLLNVVDYVESGVASGRIISGDVS